MAQTSMPLRERVGGRGAWVAAGSLAGALVMQAAIFAGVVFGLGSPAWDTSSLLLSDRHTASDLAGVAGVNCAWLIAISTLSWAIARLWSRSGRDPWSHTFANTAARILDPLVAASLLVALWWIFSQQSRALDAQLVSHWALLATLPHGTLEFAGLLLPLAAGVSCIFAPAEKPGRLMLKTIFIALLLIVSAALVEVYLGSQLLRPYRA